MFSVLIVEDEVIIAKRIERELLTRNFRVAGIAVDEEEALAILKTNIVDIVVLDVQINGLTSGIDLAKTIKIDYQLPFVYLTSFSDEETKESIIESGALGYLLKPVNYNNLITTLELGYANHQLKSNQRIIIHSGKVKHIINFNNLLFLQSKHIYVEVRMFKEYFFVRSSMQNMIVDMPINKLLRISRGVIVNKDRIDCLNGNLLFVGGHEFRVSNSYIKIVRAALKK
jgi:DNA-binding LytR/AlgR family response regulator